MKKNATTPNGTGLIITPELIEAINRVVKICHQNAKEHGFHPDETRDVFLPKAVANIHGEASELWEAFRKGQLDKPCDKANGLSCQSEELADLFIRVCDMSYELGTNLGFAVAEKHHYNLSRPYRHGDKCA